MKSPRMLRKGSPVTFQPGTHARRQRGALLSFSAGRCTVLSERGDTHTVALDAVEHDDSPATMPALDRGLLVKVSRWEDPWDGKRNHIVTAAIVRLDRDGLIISRPSNPTAWMISERGRAALESTTSQEN